MLYDKCTTKLINVPNIKVLLFRAFLKKSNFHSEKYIDPTLPTNKFYYDNAIFDENICGRYHQVVDWDPTSKFIHPCYLHSLAFPLHMKLLLLPEFVFPLMGLVHVKNQINQARPIKKHEVLSVISSFGQLELHSKGWLFSIIVKFFSGNEIVWQSKSTHLFRTEHGRDIAIKDKALIDAFIDPVNTSWKFDSDLGSLYANVSGDFNPIHLSKWLAKMFGFKQHIIHGMFTKSYCISALHKKNPILFEKAFEINTTFKQPLYLPSQVIMAAQRLRPDDTNNEQRFMVRGVGTNDEKQPLYLIGSIRTTQRYFL